LPRFSPDGRTLYYLQRSRSNRRYVSGELWTADVNSGKRERLFDDFLLADYSMSRDGTQVLLVAIAEDGATSVWIADVDRPSTPRRVTTANADRAFFGKGDDVIFVGVDEMGRRFLNRVPRSGGNPEKAFPEPVIYVYDVSPDGHAAAVWRGGGVEIVSLHGAGTVTASVICAAAGGDNRGTTPPCVSWAPHGELLFMYDRTAGPRLCDSAHARGRIASLPSRRLRFWSADCGTGRRAGHPRTDGISQPRSIHLRVLPCDDATQHLSSPRTRRAQVRLRALFEP
jgi:hypothetical protein